VAEPSHRSLYYDRHMRWIVGDVHGCVRELDDLLRIVRFDPTRDEVWCTGDLVNTGPESLQTLRLWREIGGTNVLGNHDVYALLARTGRVARRRDRLEELFRADEAEALLGALRDCPAMALIPREGRVPGVRLLHAGVNPTWRRLDEIAARLDASPHDDDWLQSDVVAFLTRVRCCNGAGELARFVGRPEDAPPPFRPWDAFYEGDEFIVHGHWAMRGFYRNARTMGLDSACVYGGKLTAWCVEEDRIESVACREALGYRP
jgi:bis(5'-nucleosyl)-tetraphosphatase (symmetrical)